MAALVIAEHDGRLLKAGTLNTVSAATLLGDDVHVLVAGSGCEAAAEYAARINGVTRVLIADAAHLGDELAENLAPLIVDIAKKNYTHLAAPASTSVKI